MATIVSALLQTAQDRESGVPERVAILESAVTALSDDARRFQLAVRCPASFLAAPKNADLGPSHMDPDEEAGTAASFDQTAAVSGSCRPTPGSGCGIVPTHDPSVNSPHVLEQKAALSREQGCTKRDHQPLKRV